MPVEPFAGVLKEPILVSSVRDNQGRIPTGTAPQSSALRQRTLKTSISCAGVGLHSGTRVTMTLHPAEPDTGIRFRRVDIAGGGAIVPALWSSVGDTRLNTCLKDDAGHQVRTVEHLMSALAGMGVDNALIDITGPEVPAMDGSAAPFLFLVECAGVVEQDASRRAIKVLRRVTVRDGEKVAELLPSTGFSLEVTIDFPVAAIRRQETTVVMSAGAFKNEISRARSFGFEQEVTALRAAGLALGGSLENAIVISSDGQRVLNEDGLRYEDEFVRHKILDAIGDLSLAGAPLIGHFRGVRCGHEMNNRLLRSLFADSTAWALVDMEPADVGAAPVLAPRHAAAAPA
ncbi:MAG TPA: UDP-3-O-acyl-N-acetylglucosamine deacetylase [Magnetospirillaceae bacterium]